MKRLLRLTSFLVGLVLLSGTIRAIPAVTLNTIAVPAANLNQGTLGFTTNIIYIVQADVATDPVNFTNIQFTITGTQDNNDVTFFRVLSNTSPSLSGAVQEGTASGLFAAPHSYTVSFTRAMAAGSTRYFIITADIPANATHNNTIKIDGAVNPVSFAYSVAPVLNDLQSDLAGVQTIKAADLTYTSIAVPAADMNQGTSGLTGNTLYIVQVTNTSTISATISNVSFTAGGTHDNNDVVFFRVLSNSTPSLTGATLEGSLSGAFAAPHLYAGGISATVAAGATRYFIISADISASATHNNTIKIDGAANPVSFTFTTAPNITNNQTDLAGVQTIKAADLTYTSIAVPAANMNQGTSGLTGNTLYIVQVTNTSTISATISNVSFTAGGTHDNNDVVFFRVLSNSTPSLTGATLEGSLSGAFAAPHLYAGGISATVAAGATRYFIISADISASATHNNTIKIDGAANPVSFTFTTAPNITNNQSDLAGVQTIQAAGITQTSIAVPAGMVLQGTSGLSGNILYILQVTNTSAIGATISSISFTAGGTHDNNDVGFFRVLSNSTPSLTGASLEGSLSGAFAAPHLYAGGISATLAAGATRYFIISADISASATHNNTIKIDGAANPVSFTFTTAPTITNNQSDLAGVQTIKGPEVALSSVAVPAANLIQGSSGLAGNIVYIVKADGVAFNSSINTISFTVDGTHDNNDVSFFRVLSNSTPAVAGATLEGSVAGSFAGPHTYNMSITYNLTSGSTRYFIITADISTSATHNNTIRINGALNPVSFGYTTSPIVTNTQADLAGVQTLKGPEVNLSTPVLPGGSLFRGETNKPVYIVQVDNLFFAQSITGATITAGGSFDADDITQFSLYINSTPTLSGATLLQSQVPATGAPANLNFAFNQPLAAGVSRYFIVTANVSATATLGNTVKFDGAAQPALFSYSLAPFVVNTQADNAGSFAISTALPVNLLSFAVRTEAGQNILQWSTTTETNSDYFAVEFSTDGLRFSEAGRVAAAGNSSNVRTYLYTHNGIPGTTMYYRLRLTDADGFSRYSAVIRLAANRKELPVQLYPNPVREDAWVTLAAEKEETLQVNVYDITGRKLSVMKINVAKGQNRFRLSVASLPPAVYKIVLLDQQNAYRGGAGFVKTNE